MSLPSAISGTPSVHPLFQAILDSPTDHYLKLVYSDFLEEQGKSAEALAWKWIGENGKSPTKCKTIYDWWSEWMVETHGKPSSSSLSDAIVVELKALKGIWGKYRTQSEAYLDLVRVLVENPKFME